MTHRCEPIEVTGGWRALCACGWTGSLREHMLEAATDAGEHPIDVSTREDGA